jgi:hypothetical protein
MPHFVLPLSTLGLSIPTWKWVECPGTTINALTYYIKVYVWTFVLYDYWMHKVSWYHAVDKGNTKCGISSRLKNWPGDFDLWHWKSIGFQIILTTKYVPSLVKIHWQMLILECSQGCYGRTDGRTVALLYPFTTSLARGTGSNFYHITSLWAL